MSNGRPITFVEYLCGHSNPVRGSGGRVNRPCLFCARTPKYAFKCFPDEISTPGHPSPDCDCDMCQSCIP